MKKFFMMFVLLSGLYIATDGKILAHDAPLPQCGNVCSPDLCGCYDGWDYLACTFGYRAGCSSTVDPNCVPNPCPL